VPKKPPASSRLPESYSSHEKCTVLAVTPCREDQAALRQIFSHSCWKLHQAVGYRDALSILRSDRMPVVLCDSRLPDGDWKDLLSQIAILTDPPQLIVSSMQADDQLWSEVLHMGGYDVLAKPLDSTEVLRAVRAAAQRWTDLRKPAWHAATA
jgi:DNA-binding NtrC family response regulator